MKIDTPRGEARVEISRPAGTPASLLVLGHGAGGDVQAADLQAVRAAALAANVTVALVTQPYRVAGRKAPAPAGHLDEAWLAVLAALDEGDLPVVTGGRSSGARVACRTAKAVGAAGVVALAFPSHPPGKPEKSREDELVTGCPTLVVNGDRDPFGVPGKRRGVDLVVLSGEGHDLRKDATAVGSAVLVWLRRHGWAM
ncbi:alpha/beta hydrolase family protein [Hamadaea tsunoensis]|uniref:alpha/beta hydrolase family protein n=1 Tax=Hamadaea tsunoensis TaxID=53368 RepID=UPI0003FC729F|nr:alpha/beta family hydrolase [Hamadaea tsunoensis]